MEDEGGEKMNLIKRPEGLTRLIECVMSNFDHEIDEDAAFKLLEGKHYAQYSARDFCGYVYYVSDEGIWRCEIWQNHSYNHLLEAGSLRLIMDQACEKFGSDWKGE